MARADPLTDSAILAHPSGHGVDVVFVSMPYAAVERPSLAIGTLAAGLEQAGFSTRAIHANMDFAARIGRQIYEIVNNSDITHQIGEWTFSEAVFDQAGDVDQFTAGLQERGFGFPGLRDLLVGLRKEAGAFVTDLADQIIALRPGIVGCSSVFQQHCASLAVLRRIKALNPNIVTMLGGPNCEGEMGMATHENFGWVDFVVSGEAEKLLPQLCRNVFVHGNVLPAEVIPFGVFAQQSRDATTTDRTGALARPDAERALIANLDDLPVPTFDDYFDQLDLSPIRDFVIPGLPIETSRGCWWGAKHHCTFCGLNGVGMAFRAKSQDRVKEEICELSKRYGLKKFMAVDNILDNRYFKQVMPFLADEGDMLWFYETKANLTRAQLLSLSRAGVRWIQPGIEAFHDGLLGLLDKGCSTVINVQMLKWAYNYGIWVTWNHLYGAPGEKPEWFAEIADWLPLIAHLQPPMGGNLTRIRFDRFSPYFNRSEDFGLKLSPCWGYGQVYPLPAEQVYRQAYFFQDDLAGTGDYAVPLARVIHDWATRFYATRSSPTAIPRRSDDAPELRMIQQGDGLTVKDTRPCATHPLHRLTDLQARICRALDGALGPEALVQALARDGGSDPAMDVTAAVRHLIDCKIIADFGGKLLCLATDEMALPYQPFGDFAGGMLSIAARPARTSPVTMPWDLTLHDLFAPSQQAG
jgi:ribosomal peptide maturation radical SAM protein 1